MPSLLCTYAIREKLSRQGRVGQGPRDSGFIVWCIDVDENVLRHWCSVATERLVNQSSQLKGNGMCCKTDNYQSCYVMQVMQFAFTERYKCTGGPMTYKGHRRATGFKPPFFDEPAQ